MQSIIYLLTIHARSSLLIVPDMVHEYTMTQF